jgi:uncharacterized protein with GYD domain
MLFIMSLSFTDQGIRKIKDGPKRAKAARELANKLGVEIKQALSRALLKSEAAAAIC